MKRQRPDDSISATEIACFAYCPEQWRLQYGLGLAPENQAALKAGVRHHAAKAWAERLAGLSLGLGRRLIAAAAVGLLVFLLWSRR
jgi:hypothetical protein